MFADVAPWWGACLPSRSQRVRSPSSALVFRGRPNGVRRLLAKEDVWSSILLDRSDGVRSRVPYKDPAKLRAYQRAWCAANRAEWLAAHGPCVQCGSELKLEVDHIDTAQKVSHKVWSWAPTRRNAELAKCQVLCGECHLEKTRISRRSRIRHGTSHLYDALGCRCSPCRDYKSRVNRNRTR